MRIPCSSISILAATLQLAASLSWAAEKQPPTWMLAYMDKDYDRAIELVEADITQKPSEFHLYEFAGNVYEKIGGADKAVYHYRKTLELLGDKAPFWPFNVRYLLGRMLYLMGTPEEALPELRQALLHPNAKAPDTRHNISGMIAHASEMTGLLDEALQVYESLVAARPQDDFARVALDRLQRTPPEARRTLTRTWELYREGKYELALQEVALVQVASPYADHIRGIILLAQNKAEEAITYLRKALWEMPRHPNIYRHLRTAHFSIKYDFKLLMELTAVVGRGFKMWKTECPQLTAQAKALLERYLWFPDAYKLLAVCGVAQGDRELAGKYALINESMINALFFNGPDGRTQDSAIPVLNIREEYLFLEKRNFQLKIQGLSRCGTKRCDILIGISKETGITREFYFDISHFRYN